MTETDACARCGAEGKAAMVGFYLLGGVCHHYGRIAKGTWEAVVRETPLCKDCLRLVVELMQEEKHGA